MGCRRRPGWCFGVCVAMPAGLASKRRAACPRRKCELPWDMLADAGWHRTGTSEKVLELVLARLLQCTCSCCVHLCLHSAGCSDGGVHSVDVESGAVTQPGGGGGHAAGVLCADHSDTGACLATGSEVGERSTASSRCANHQSLQIWWCGLLRCVHVSCRLYLRSRAATSPVSCSTTTPSFLRLSNCNMLCAR